MLTVMRKTALLYLALHAVGLSSAIDAEFKIVKTDQGPVKGYRSKDGDLFVFYGIPYATAPTGPHKFKAPLPGPIWTKVFEAVESGIYCHQAISPWGPHFQENCLIANVWVPDTEDTNLPVVVYVHGGGYTVGASNILTLHSIVNEGKVIAVDFNYRLGPYGFLCLGTEDIPGNAGMKDMVAALRWVQRNIASFGGNPDDVTVAGFSAGSSAVDLLTLSDITRGLFHKVIPESGSAMSTWSVQKDPIKNAKIFAERSNIKTDSIQVLEEFYKSASIDQLTYPDFLAKPDNEIYFVPCIEKDVGQEMFLKEAPIDILKGGNFPKLPYLFGFANMEGLIRSQNFTTWKDVMNTHFEQFLPANLQFHNEAEKKVVASNVKKFYFGDKPITQEAVHPFLDFYSDSLFTYSTLQTNRLQKEAGNNNIYLYEFSYTDKKLLERSLFPHIHGAPHCAQSEAISDSTLDNMPSTEEYKRMRAIARQAWINFIKTGKPVPVPTEDYPDGWPAASADGSPYMELNLPTKLHQSPLLEERVRFWDKIYEEHYSSPVAPQSKAKRSEL